MRYNFKASIYLLNFILRDCQYKKNNLAGLIQTIYYDAVLTFQRKAQELLVISGNQNYMKQVYVGKSSSTSILLVTSKAAPRVQRSFGTGFGTACWRKNVPSCFCLWQRTAVVLSSLHRYLI